MCKFIRQEESTENKLVTVYYISPTPQGKAGKGNTMAEFEAITTQEAFDNAIKARLDRNTDTVKKQFEGYISPDDFKTKTADLNGKITDLTGKLAEKDTTIADLTAKNKAYETSSVKMRRRTLKHLQSLSARSRQPLLVTQNTITQTARMRHISRCLQVL